MRIALLTFFIEDNPGQFFQALASLNALKSLFPNDDIEIANVLHWGQSSDPRSRRDYIRPWRNKARIERRHKYDKARKEYFPICGPQYITPDPSLAGDYLCDRAYDLLVVGSDAVLYFCGSGRIVDEMPSLYWLAGVENTPRVMLSSCSHTTKYEELNDKQKEILQKATRKFQFIAVRDQLSLDLIQASNPAENIPLYISPDPTFSYAIDPTPAATYWEQKKIKTDKPVCGFRMPWKTPFRSEIIKLLQKEFTVVDLSGLTRNSVPLLDMGPFEWSGIFSMFDLHVTTSFHETIFCMKQGVPVYTIEGLPMRYDPVSGKSKSYYVHEEIGTLEKHYFNPYIDNKTALDVCATIKNTWREYDRENAINTSKKLGNEYLRIAQEMKNTMSSYLGKNT